MGSASNRGRKGIVVAVGGLASLTFAPMVANAQEGADSSAEIVVTGTRIARPDYQYTNPVVSTDAKAIQNSGITNMAEFLQDIPALQSSSGIVDNAGSEAETGTAGLNFLNLRGLGEDRTLVLVNSRRHVSGFAGTAAVDVNTIPTDLIERVDVLTGGASAIYGADGVSGVVNFVLRDDFEGVRFRAQASGTEAGGGEQEFFSATGGANFADGKGNIAVAVEFAHEGRISAFDRPYSSTQEVRFVRPPFASPYSRVPLSGLSWFESGTGGAIDVDGDLAADFDGTTGAAWLPGNYPGGIQSSTYAQGGSGTPTGGYGGDLTADVERFNVNLISHYDLTENVRFFSEMKFVKTKTFTLAQPSFDFFAALAPDNYYLNTKYPGMAAAAVGNGTDVNFGLPSDGFVFVTRDNFDLGVRGDRVERETFRGAWGFEGDAGKYGNWNVSYVYGSVDVRNTNLNNRFNDRFAAALDAVDDGSGNPVCRSDLNPASLGANVDWQGWATPGSFTPGPGSGCVPIDILGYGAPSAQARNWVMTNSVATSQITQRVATAYFSGTSEPFFSLPAGSIGYAFGAEWRRETSENYPAAEDQAGLTFGNAIQPTIGSFEVREAFAELSIPILKDAPFAETFAIDMAGRYSEYSTVGDTGTWKFGATWGPVKDIRVRATIAQAVRAPNISELFDPGGQTFEFITDPCDVGELGNGTSFRAANCAAILSALGADPLTYTDPNFASVPGIQRGNQSLAEETADTKTLGVIVQPRWIPRLSFSVDYYDINIENAINTLDPELLAQQCVDLPTTSNQFCSLLIRDSNPGSSTFGGVIDYVIQPVNVASFRTQGYDFTVNYLLDPEDLGAKGDWGTFNFRMVGNYLEELTFVNLPGADPDPDKGEESSPEWTINLDVLWERGKWAVNYGYNYFSETERYAIDSVSQPRLTTLPEFSKLDARSEHDMQVRYAANNGVELYAGVNNFTDQQPDISRSFYPVSPQGRTFYLGLTASFGP